MVLMEALGHQKKKFSINFTKANTKFCLSLNHDADNSYLFVNGKKSLKQAMRLLFFQLILVSEVFQLNLLLPNLEKFF